MSKQLTIIGASGHGKIVAAMAEQLGYTISFYDDAYPAITEVEHWLIKGTFLDFLTDSSAYYGAVVAIGNAKIREVIFKQLKQANVLTPTLQHVSANVSGYATIGNGCVVMPGAIINAFAVIGEGCIINSNAVVEHDCKLNDFVHMCPNTAVAGGTTIGKRTWVGIGSNIRQMLNIGSDVLIGVGSAVISDIPAEVTVVGVPAKIIK